MKILRENKKLTIHFFTCMHGRTQVARMFMQGLGRIVRASADVADIRICVAYSEDADKELCEEMRAADNDLDLILHRVSNDLVGAKWNASLNMALATGVADYYVKMDDDDIISTEAWMSMIGMMIHKVPYIGFDHVLFVDGTNGDASLFQYPNPNKVLGAIRAFSMDCIRLGVMKVLCEVMQQVTQNGAQLEPEEQRYLPYNLAGWLHTQGIVRVMGNEDGTLITRAKLWTNEWNRSLDWDSDVRLAINGYTATPVPWDVKKQGPAVADIKTPGHNIWSYHERSHEGTPYKIDKLAWLPLFDTKK